MYIIPKITNILDNIVGCQKTFHFFKINTTGGNIYIIHNRKTQFCILFQGIQAIKTTFLAAKKPFIFAK